VHLLLIEPQSINRTGNIKDVHENL
jgi:hypothetical protein